MKIKETRKAFGGGLARSGEIITQSCVREIPDADPIPDGAVKVAASTEVYDWKEDN